MTTSTTKPPLTTVPTTTAAKKELTAAEKREAAEEALLKVRKERSVGLEYAVAPGDRPLPPHPSDVEAAARSAEWSKAGSITEKAAAVRNMFISKDKDGIQSTGAEMQLEPKSTTNNNSPTSYGSLEDISAASRKQIELDAALRSRRVHGWAPPKAYWRAPSETDIKAVDHIIRRRNVEYHRTSIYTYSFVVLAAVTLFAVDLYRTRAEARTVDELTDINTALRTENESLRLQLAKLEDTTSKIEPISSTRSWNRLFKFW